MSRPLVSVVVTAFDEEAFIAQALESALSQTYAPVEVIVVDDGSTDRTAEIAQGYGVRLLRQANGGVAAARNAGVSGARGEYFTVFDADDVMPPERLELQVAEIERRPELGMVFGLTEAFVTPGEPPPAHWNPAWDHGPFTGCAGTMLARRALFALVGPYDEALQRSADLDWILRAKDLGIAATIIDELTLRYRIHSGNASADRPTVSSAMLGALRQSLARRRATAAGP